MRTLTVHSGHALRELREARGLSPEEVPYAMLREKIETRAIPSGRTIRRIEASGRMPHVRYAFGLSRFYDVPVAELWPATRQRMAA